MATNIFPESTGSSKYSGTTNDGSMTGMGIDPVGDSTISNPMTGGKTSAGTATMSGSDDGNQQSATASESSQPPRGAASSQDSPGSQSSAQKAAERYKSMAHDTVDKVADFASRYAQSPNKAIEASKSLVHEKPVVALGAAVALGVLLGSLILR